MTLNSFQESAHKFAGPNITLEECVLALNEEAGEVAGKLKRWYRGDYDDDRGFQQLRLKEDIIAELGDVFWYLSEAAYFLNVPLQDVAGNVLTKLEDRATRGVIQGSGDNR